MWHSGWLRSGLASLAVGATSLCATLAACGDDDGAGGTPDTGLTDTKPGDAGKDGSDAGPASNAPRLTVVNATHDLGPSATIGTSAAIRLCFKQGSVAQNLSVAPFPPLPDRASASNPSGPPGLYYGAGALLPTVGVDFAHRIVVPIVMNAKSLSVRGLDNVGPDQRAATCDEIVGDAADAATGFTENADYWVLPQIEVGALANGKAYLLALTGCVGDAATLNPGKCGPGFVSGGDPGLGNLRLKIYETSQTPAAVPLGAQFLYLSTQANAFFSQATAKGSIRPGFVSNAADGGGFRPITDVNPPIGALSAITAVTNVTDSDSFVFGPKSLNPSEAEAGVPLLPSSLLAIQKYSGLGSSTGATVYQDGRNYVFIAVGDPDTNETKQFIKPDGTPGGDGGDGSRFNSRFFHFLAYPADPAVEP